MKRTYALRRLLEHGALTFGQIVSITGWKPAQAWSAIDDLKRIGVVVSSDVRPAIYSLEEA